MKIWSYKKILSTAQLRIKGFGWVFLYKSEYKGIIMIKRLCFNNNIKNLGG